MLPQEDRGVILVKLDDDIGDRWMTDDQRAMITFSLTSFYKLLSRRCLVLSLLKGKLAFRNKLHRKPLLPHIVNSLSKSC